MWRVSIHAPVKERLFLSFRLSRLSGFNPRPCEGATIDDSIHILRLVKYDQFIYFNRSEVKPAPEHLVIAAILKGEIKSE
jgi:hypothetical protein